MRGFSSGTSHDGPSGGAGSRLAVALPVFDAGQCFDQVRAHDFELAPVMRGQFLQQARSLGGDAQENAAGVRLVARALEQAFFFGTIGELNDAIVAQAEALGCVSDRGDGACRGAGDLEQQLVLL